MSCLYCQAEPHHALCPMAGIEADQNRLQALHMGVDVATSDWINAWARQVKVRLTDTQREALTELFSLHHRYVDRATTERVTTELKAFYEA